MGYLFKSNIEKLLILSKIVFLHKKGLRSLAHGSRFVWVIMCVAPLGMHVLPLLPTFDRDIAIWNFLIIFLISNRHNDNTNRKPKKLTWYLYFICIFPNIYIRFKGNKLGIVLWPKVVKQYFHLKMCCIVNIQKSIPDKTVRSVCNTWMK